MTQGLPGSEMDGGRFGSGGRRLPKAVTLRSAGKSMLGKGNAVCCPGCHRFVLSSRSESTNPLIVPAVGRPSVGVLEGQREEVKI